MDGIVDFAKPILMLIYTLVLFKEAVDSIRYRKIPNISPGLIAIRKHILGGLYSAGAYIRGAIYSECILC